MAHFVFEADLHGLLKLDTPIPNAPPARWQRKAKESAGPSPAASMSPMKPANRSYSGSKTPSKTPGERRGGSGVVPGRVGKRGGGRPSLLGARSSALRPGGPPLPASRRPRDAALLGLGAAGLRASSAPCAVSGKWPPFLRELWRCCCGRTRAFSLWPLPM